MAGSRTTTTATSVVADDIEFERLPLTSVSPHPNNPRTQLGDLKELIESVREHGIQQPLVVEPHPDDPGMYLLVAGHRRRAAAEAVGATTVPAIVRPATELGDQVASMLVENLHRADLTPIEEGDAYQQLLDLGYSPDAVAKKTGRARKTVQARVKVAGLPESARDRLLNGQLTLDDAVKMSKYSKDAKAMARLERAAQRSRWEFEHELQLIGREKNDAAHRAKNLKALQSLPYPTVPNDDVPESAIELDEIDQITDADGWEEHGNYHGMPIIERAAWYADHHLGDDGQLCVGHVLSTWGNGSDMRTAWCTTPAAHPTWSSSGQPLADLINDEGELTHTPDTHRGLSLEQRREQEEREQARLELRREMAAAAATRRAFLREVIAGPDGEDMATWAAREKLLEKMKRGYGADDRRALAQVLIPNASEKFLDNPDEVQGDLIAVVEELTLPQLVLANHVYDSTETLLEDPNEAGWWWNIDRTATWLKELVDHWSYPLTPIEQRLVDANTPSRQPPADTDDTGPEAEAS